MDKKKFTLLYRIILIILAGALTLFTLLPAVTMDVSIPASNMDEDWNIIFTGIEAPHEVTLRFGIVPMVETAITLVKRFSEYEGWMTGDNDLLWKTRELIAEDENFANAVYRVYGFLSLFAEEESQGRPSTGLGDRLEVISMIANVISVGVLVFLIIAGLVCPVILLIKFVSLLIKTLRKTENKLDEDLEKAINPLSLGEPTWLLLMLSVLSAAFMSNISIGVAIVGICIIFALTSILGAVKIVVLAEENRKQILFKQVITVVSVLMAVVLLCNFSFTDVWHEYLQEVEPFSSLYYASETINSSGSDELDAVWRTIEIYAIFILVVEVLAIILLVTIINYGAERIAEIKVKNKNGEMILRSNMLKTAIIILICAMIPLFITVNSAEARDEAYTAGHFKVWYTEYKEDGSVENLRYTLLKRYVEEGNKEISNLKEKLKDADGEEAEDISKRIESGKQEVKAARKEISEIESKSRNVAISLIAAIILLLAELAYMIVPKYLDKWEQALPLGTSVPSGDADEAIENDQPILKSTSENGEPSAEELFAMGEEYAQRTE